MQEESEKLFGQEGETDTVYLSQVLHKIRRKKGMEKRTEHHRFYEADFKREAKWLAEQHKEGWRLVDTDGATYEFEKDKKEDWIYRTDDFKRGDDPNTYLDKYKMKGWQFVCRANHRVYFRKKHMGEMDYSAFTDDETRMAFSRQKVRERTLRMLPIYILIVIYLYLILFTGLFKNMGEVPYAIFSTLGFVGTIIFSFDVGMQISENRRWKKVKLEGEQGVQEMSLEEAIEQMENGQKPGKK